MASLNGTFDATEVAPAVPLELLPPGKYLAHLIESEMLPTKSGDGQLLKLVFDPYRYFGEAYADGHIRLEGDLVEMLEAVFRSAPPSYSARRGRFLPDNNSTAASKSNIHQHYDLGNAFYQLWLDNCLGC